MTKQNKALVETDNIPYRQFLMENPKAREAFVNAGSFKMKKLFKMIYLLPKDRLDPLISYLESRMENSVSVQ